MRNIFYFYFILFAWSLSQFSQAQMNQQLEIEPGFKISCSPLQNIQCDGLFPIRNFDQNFVADLSTEAESLQYRLQTLKKANQNIRIQALIFSADEVGLRIAKILKDKVRQGVDVKIIVDSVSNISKTSEDTQMMYNDLFANGVQIEGFEPALNQWINEVDLKDLASLNKRFHEKLWIVDANTENATAVIGGLNIANEYFQLGDSPSKIWRDQDIALRGEIIKDIVKTFDRNWNSYKEVKNKKPEIFNPDTIRNMILKFLKSTKSSQLDVSTDYLGNPYHKDFLNPKIISKIMKLEEDEIHLDFHPANLRFIQSRPRLKEKYITQQYLHEIRNAKNEVLIVNAYFVPSPELQEAIRIATSEKHIPVYIITNSPQTNDLPIMAYVARSFYVNMFGKTSEEQQANKYLHIYEWQGDKFGMGTIHAKYAIFDFAKLIVGSFNLDPRSENLNSESVILVENKVLADKMRQRTIEQDLRKCTEIDLARAISFITTDQETIEKANQGKAFLKHY